MKGIQPISTPECLFASSSELPKLNDMVIVDRKNKRKYQLPSVLNKVIQGDALQVLPKLPEESVDCVFMDPPYFLQLPKKRLKRWNVKTDVDGVDDAWDKFGSFAEYDDFIAKLLTESRRLMKPSATIWVIATYHSIFRIGRIMQDMGFWILNDVHWVKTNPMPNWLGVRFTNATETLIFATRGKEAKGYTFNRKCAKEFGIGSVAANVWMMPLCNGTERLKDAQGIKLHSTQKPLELLRRVLMVSTKEGDVVLDPVAGVGTTGYAAKMLGRNFIMNEISEKYVEGIKTRFSNPVIPKKRIPKVSRKPYKENTAELSL
jgi:DNA modification methylase